MKLKPYELYTSIFGHNYGIRYFLSRFSDKSLMIDSSVEIGRNTQFYGNVNLGPNASIGSGVEISGEVNIKQNVSIGSNGRLDGDIRIGKGTNLNGNNSVVGNVNIGKYCAIARRSRMRTIDHPTFKAGIQGELYNSIGSDLGLSQKGPIEIGNDVWICSDAKILSDVEIGDGAVIAANSVVVEDVEPYSIVAGNPANHKKYRFNKSKRKQLKEISWWDWGPEKKKRNLEFFETDLREVDDIKSMINE